jgi:hypothetical protein
MREMEKFAKWLKCDTPIALHTQRGACGGDFNGWTWLAGLRMAF